MELIEVTSDNTGGTGSPIPKFPMPADEQLFRRDRVGQESEERLAILKRWGVEAEKSLVSVQT